MFLFLTIFSFSLLLVEPVTEGTQILYFQKKKKKKKNFIALILPDTFLALISLLHRSKAQLKEYHKVQTPNTLRHQMTVK